MAKPTPEEIGLTRHAQIEKQRWRWQELREAAKLVDAQLEDGGVTEAAHTRLADAIEATTRPWLT